MKLQSEIYAYEDINYFKILRTNIFKEKEVSKCKQMIWCIKDSYELSYLSIYHKEYDEQCWKEKDLSTKLLKPQRSNSDK